MKNQNALVIYISSKRLEEVVYQTPKLDGQVMLVKYLENLFLQ